MSRVKVHLGKRSYNIVIGYNHFAELGRFLKALDIGKDALIVTNPVIKSLYGHKLQSALRTAGFRMRIETVPDQEKSKSEREASKLIRKIAGRDGENRRLFIIAFGGGVIGDLAGYIAAIYKRGIPYIQIPTTLLAQADSAIGGKVAIDLSCGKNLLGAFYQPRLVFSDLKMLESLPLCQVKSGLAEVVKYGAALDGGLFEYLEENYKKILHLDTNALKHIVLVSSRLKANIVARDERDTNGIRAVLNYGHTIGHAIEAAGGYSRAYSHGEAVGLGMIAASRISQAMGLAGQSCVSRIENLLYCLSLPTEIHGLDISRILAAQAHDKKFIHGRNRFVLLEKIGKTGIYEGIPKRIIRDTLKKMTLK